MRESALRYDWLDGCVTTERIERSSKRAKLREQSRVKRESSSKGRRAKPGRESNSKGSRAESKERVATVAEAACVE